MRDRKDKAVGGWNRILGINVTGVNEWLLIKQLYASPNETGHDLITQWAKHIQEGLGKGPYGSEKQRRKKIKKVCIGED